MTTTPAPVAQHPLVGVGSPDRAAVNLYWLPLGAGGHCVRLNGRAFEMISARKQHREPCDLYHSAIEITLGADQYVIEMAPVWNERIPERGVVAEGSVGMRGAGRLRLFRYEIRCWRDGRIPDVAEAVDSPQCLSTDPDHAARMLRLVHQVPTAVWGRDELGTGDMWNSNSLVSWLIVRGGIAVPANGRLAGIQPPGRGRAPGWRAGITVAARAETQKATLRARQPTGVI